MENKSKVKNERLNTRMTAYKLAKQEGDDLVYLKKVAETKREHGDRFNGFLFIALDIPVFWKAKGVKEFNQSQLDYALNYSRGIEGLVQERQFILDCLANLDENNNILIEFN